HTARSETMCSQPCPEVQLPQFQRAGKSDVSNNRDKNSHIAAPRMNALTSVRGHTRLQIHPYSRIVCRLALFWECGDWLPPSAGGNGTAWRGLSTGPRRGACVVSWHPAGDNHRVA